MQDIKVAAIMSKPGIPHATKIVPPLVEWLKERGVSARCDVETAKYLGREDGLTRAEAPEGADLVIVLGGDGTLLSAARALAGRDIPLLPVNLGGLGFLTAVTLDEMYPELERTLQGEQRVAPRRMLHCDLVREDYIIQSFEALNDVVLAKSSLARIIDLETHVDTHFIANYKADGVIVATPTGSTAYSLSAGGPIIFPPVSAICLTPICPHTLTYRPVIVPDTSVVTIICRAHDHEAYLTVDGQVGVPIMENDRILCRSSSHSVSLIRPPRSLFFDVLRQKLHWGER